MTICLNNKKADSCQRVCLLWSAGIPKTLEAVADTCSHNRWVDAIMCMYATNSTRVVMVDVDGCIKQDNLFDIEVEEPIANNLIVKSEVEAWPNRWVKLQLVKCVVSQAKIIVGSARIVEEGHRNPDTGIRIKAFMRAEMPSQC